VRATSPAVKLNAAKRLQATAEQAERGEGKSLISPVRLNAARRLIATAKQTDATSSAPPTKSSKKPE
jgi:hypothetical protein